MPRNKSFDPEKVLETVLYLFWEKGYTNTSLADLERATKLNRASLYNIYKDKEHLFEACIDRYVGMIEKSLDAQLNDKGLDGIISFFRRYTKKPKNAPQGITYGCLMVNTSLEWGTLSNKIQKKIEKYNQMLKKRFEKEIDKAKKRGEISNKIDTQSNADYLVATMFGILVQVRLTKNVLAAPKAAYMVIKTIKSWKSN